MNIAATAKQHSGEQAGSCGRMFSWVKISRRMTQYDLSPKIMGFVNSSLAFLSGISHLRGIK
jgi:hypothetical protein